MQQEIEYRISEEYARTVFAPDEGKTIGNAIRFIKLPADDDRLKALAQLYSRHQGKGFYSWKIIRRYSAAEIDQAKLHLLQIKTGILPTGEECGTEYDDSEMCPLCGAGRVQRSPLRLRLTNAPKTSELACTWGGEIIISARLVRLLIDAGMTGWGLGPVQRSKQGQEEPFTFSETGFGQRLLKAATDSGIPYPSPEFYVWVNRAEQQANFLAAVKEHEGRKSPRRRLPGGTSPEWYQLFITSEPVELSPATRFGFNPLDDDPDGRNRCPLGLRDHVVGLNLLSHATVRATTWTGIDLARSREMVGARRGLYNPRSLLFISPRLRKLLIESGVKGWASEVVNLW